MLALLTGKWEVLTASLRVWRSWDRHRERRVRRRGGSWRDKPIGASALRIPTNRHPPQSAPADPYPSHAIPCKPSNTLIVVDCISYSRPEDLWPCGSHAPPQVASCESAARGRRPRSIPPPVPAPTSAKPRGPEGLLNPPFVTRKSTPHCQAGTSCGFPPAAAPISRVHARGGGFVVSRGPRHSPPKRRASSLSLAAGGPWLPHPLRRCSSARRLSSLTHKRGPCEWFSLDVAGGCEGQD